MNPTPGFAVGRVRYVLGPSLETKASTPFVAKLEPLGHRAPAGPWMRRALNELQKTGRVFRFYTGPRLLLMVEPGVWLVCAPRDAVAYLAMMFDLDLDARSMSLLASVLATTTQIEFVRDTRAVGDALELEVG